MDSTYSHVGLDPQMFVDNCLIECTQGLTRRWYKPERQPGSPQIEADRPWEKTLYFTYSNHCVLRDPADGLFKCWYEDLGPVDGKGHPMLTRLLYAESEDGITFTKPELDVCEIDGQRTNIVMGYVEGAHGTDVNPWAAVGVHSNGIVLDPHPPSEDQRFRTIFSASYYDETSQHRHVIQCAHSADGIHWVPYAAQPTFGSSGSHLSDVSCVHYDHDSRQFVQNTRHGLMYDTAQPLETPRLSNWFQPYYPHRPDLLNKRRVYQTRSHDFIHWSDPILVSSPDDSMDNIDEAHYGMQQFRVGRMHFGTLGVFRYVENEMEVRLLYSRDGINFQPTDRAQPFLAPQGEGRWDAYMVSMASQPIEGGGDWWFYHGGSRCHHDWWIGPPEGINEPEYQDPEEHVRFGLGLAKLRREGIASLRGSRQREGYVMTRPLMSSGNRLVINARSRTSGGSIVAEVVGLDNEVAGSCRLNICDPFSGNETDHTITWRGSPEVPDAGQWRKLRFYLRNAEIFSFRFDNI